MIVNVYKEQLNNTLYKICCKEENQQPSGSVVEAIGGGAGLLPLLESQSSV